MRDCSCGSQSAPDPHSGTRSNGGSVVDVVMNAFDFDALVSVGAVGEGVADNGAALKIGIAVGDELAHDGHQVASVPS